MRQRDIFQSSREMFNKLFSFLYFNHQQDIIVFSHLRWDFVFQRPHDIVTKLAKKNRILFIEEPIPFHRLEQENSSVFHPHKNITILQPKIITERVKQDLPLLIAKQIREQRIKNPILWFYVPSFRDLVPMLNHSLVVYDYVEQHSVDDPVNAEYLLTAADIVFSSEEEYFEKKKDSSPNLYSLSDAAVFSEDIEVRLQRIIQGVITAKRQPTLYTKPFYHPFLPHITATNKRTY